MNGFRFVCKEITINEANDVVNVSWKLDEKSVLCTGVIASVVENAALSSNKRICETGLLFAGKKDTIHIPVDNTPINERKAYQIHQIEEPIKHNMNVDGYVNDFGNSDSYPYTVNFAFRVVDNK